MTVARYVLPRRTYLLTRRCTQRQFLLKPGTRVRQVFVYCIAMAAQLHNVEIHTLIVLSNHYHLVVSECDAQSRISDFMHWLNLQVAKAMNVHWKRSENFWDNSQFNMVDLLDEETVIEKIVYTITNAVAAGLVAKPEHWPGLCSKAKGLGRKSFSANRPKIYFRDVLPANAKFTLTLPPGFKHMTADAFQSLVQRHVDHRVERLRQLRLASGRKVLGRKAILAENPFDSPGRKPPNRELSPRIACKDKWRRIEALTALKAFFKAYKEAWIRWKEGDHNVVFPYGTYLMRKRHNARCATGPPQAA